MTRPVQLPLHDDDLVIRWLEVEDAAFVQGSRTHPIAERYNGWRPPTVVEVEELARTQSRGAPGTENGVRQLVIEHQGRPVGDFGVQVPDPGRQVELGIVIHPDFQGRRLASRACRLLIGALFASGIHRVAVRVDPRNTASLRLFERLGFRREGLELECWYDPKFEEWTDEVLFAVLRREWPTT